jgi:hypothetical protein
MRKNKQNQIRVLSLVKNVCGYLTLRYTSIVGICLLGATAQLNYRIPGSFLFLALPGMGVALSVFGFVLLIKQLLTGVSPHHPFRQTLDRIEQLTYLLVCVFVLSSILLYTNGKLDRSALVNRSAEVLAISRGKINVGLEIPYAWVTCGLGGSAGQAPSSEERAACYGRAAVLVQVRSGYYGIPWAFHIEPDEEKYNSEILKMGVGMEGLVNFYIDRQR